MKRLCFLFAIALLLYSCNSSTEPKTVEEPVFKLMPEHSPQNHYKIDVKTKLVDKFSERGAKYGTISYIHTSNFLTEGESGEDYSLWIKELGRSENDTSRTITYNLELQPPSAVFEGTPYRKKHIIIVYTRDSYTDFLEQNADAGWVADRFRSYAERCAKAAKITAYVNNIMVATNPIPVTVLCRNILNDFLSMFTDENMQQCQQIEAVICGANNYGWLKEWLWQHEQGQF